MYAALAINEKAAKATSDLRKSPASVNFAAKNNGEKIKRFFRYWWGLIRVINSITVESNILRRDGLHMYAGSAVSVFVFRNGRF